MAKKDLEKEVQELKEKLAALEERVKALESGYIKRN